MCGIGGYISNSKLSEEQLKAISSKSNSIAHRGPDADGLFHDEISCFFHRRLSIIDLDKRSDQPMHSANDRYVLVYNGECYNYLELRADLEQKGQAFQTSSDSEVVLYLLIHEGIDGLDRINGFFALGLYDREEKSLLLARDRYGIKPLYYEIQDDGFAFGSEMQSVYTGRKREIDRYSLQAYLHLNYIPSPHSIFKGVRKLKPGHSIMVKQADIGSESSFVKTENKHASDADLHKQVFEGLEKSVQRRLIADVDVACFLSGGLDSSIIAGLANKHSTKQISTYNVAFKGDHQYDESALARKVAKHFGTDHHEIEIDERQLLDNIPSLLKGMGEPFADSSAIAMYELCRVVGSEVKVALSGDGGDELFGGYLKHRASQMAYRQGIKNRILAASSPLLNVLPSSRTAGFRNEIRKLKRYANALSMNDEMRYWTWAGFGTDFENPLIKAEAFDPQLWLHEVVELPLENMEASLRADIQMVLEGDMLVKVDRMSMAHGLEVRVPMLDKDFAGFIQKLPAKVKLNEKEGKLLLKESFRDFLPKGLTEEPKHGFEVPLKKWMINDLSEIRTELLDPNFIQEQGIFNLEEVQRVEKMLHSNNDGNAAMSLWNLMVFNHWWKENQNEIV